MMRAKTFNLTALMIFLVSGAGVSREGAAGESKGAGTDTLVQYRMEELVVTAGRIASPLKDVPISVSFIGRRDIDASLKNSSTDLAGKLPGVFIMRTGDFGRSDVNIRGLGSRGRRSLVLIDGKPERMALFDCTVTHSFPLHDVEKVEVVKGASSTLYGSGAMGGVMNVIPRRIRNEVELDLRGAAGTHETYLSGGRVAGRKGHFAGSVSADHRESGGHVANSAYRGTDVIVSGEAAVPGGIQLEARAKYFDGYKEEPLRYTDDPSAVPDIWNAYERGSVDAGIKGAGDTYRYGASYYRNFGEHRFSDGWHSKDATDGVIAHGRFEVPGGFEISGGADYRSQRGELPGQSGSEWDKREGGAYLNAEYTVRERVILSAGARANRDEVSGNCVSPSFGAVWRLFDGTSIRAVAAHGFRSPQLNELYMFPSSNENLEAEKMWNYEAGILQKVPGGLELDLSVYRMDGENMIELAGNPSPPPMMRFENSGDFVFDGIEVSLEGNWAGGIDASVSWSRLDPGRWTQGRPGTKVDMSLSKRSDRWNVRLSGGYVDDYFAGNDSTDPIPSFFVADIYGEAEIVGGVSAFGGVSNAFDEEYLIYTDLPGGQAGLYVMPGRTFTAGFKYGY